MTRPADIEPVVIRPADMEPPVEPAGPTTINGRPALGTEDVRAWFGTGNIIPVEFLNRLAAAVNHLDLFSHLWSDDPEHARARRENASLRRLVRIKQALADLSADLPLTIADTARTGADVTDASTLLRAVEAMRPAAAAIEEPKPGREKQRWHLVARNLRDVISRFGVPKASGVDVVKRALNHLGVTSGGQPLTRDQVRAGLRIPRPERRKQPAKEA